tara:strand:- start:410 stop:847 length:438 start_codon:yes stop_codon:yes gene_type:complete
LAIVDKNNKNWYVVDRDEDTFIGMSLPLTFDGDNPTKTTLESVKQNVLNLCSTEMGERVMQPNLGVRLKRFLFEPFSEELIFQVKEVVNESINYWLPFVKINDIRVQMSDNDTGDFRNAMEISVDFSLIKDPNTHESVQVTVDGE